MPGYIHFRPKQRGYVISAGKFSIDYVMSRTVKHMLLGVKRDGAWEAADHSSALSVPGSLILRVKGVPTLTGWRGLHSHGDFQYHNYHGLNPDFTRGRDWEPVYSILNGKITGVWIIQPDDGERTFWISGSAYNGKFARELRAMRKAGIEVPVDFDSYWLWHREEMTYEGAMKALRMRYPGLRIRFATESQVLSGDLP